MVTTKTYVATRKNKIKGELELRLKSLNAKLICPNAQKYKPTREIVAIEREIIRTKGSILASVTAFDLLDDSVVSLPFRISESCFVYKL